MIRRFSSVAVSVLLAAAALPAQPPPARRASLPPSGVLSLSTTTACPHDASPAPGYQVALQLAMTLDGTASGFQAFVQYDTGLLSFRGDLSSYAGTPFPLHISSLAQADDGVLELDGSVSLGGVGTGADAVLATLVFDADADCGPSVPVVFQPGSRFDSVLSDLGLPLNTTLLDPAPFALDDTPPTVQGVPADIITPADAGSCSGAVVSFTSPTALDDCDAAPMLSCSPPSGSHFPVGTTTVICTATDACGNSGTGSFHVTVTPTNLVNVTIELSGVKQPVSRCIHFQASSCSSSTDVPLSFVDHDFDGGAVTPVRATASFEMPCGAFTALCAKDRQHTRWATVPLALTGTSWTTTAVLSLHGGDTDDDGDVDINDVTWFLGQFGDLAVAGGCPFNGTSRDADFSNNGAVASEDYAFLVEGWLATSSCPCADGLGGLIASAASTPASVPASTPALVALDVNGDGRVNADDVERFEIRHGLSGELSARMRAASR